MSASPDVQVKTASGEIVAVGYFPAGTEDPEIAIVPMTPAIAAAWDQPGTKILHEDGTVTVVPLPLPPVLYTRSVTVDAVIRTTDATLTEVFRLATEARQLYRGTFALMAIDAVSGDSKDTEVRLNFRQQAGAAVQAGATRPLYDPIETPAASSWAIQGAADGPDFLVGVRGAVGRTIDWALTGQILVYAPEGLTG